jgi:hypothetical protein
MGSLQDVLGVGTSDLEGRSCYSDMGMTLMLGELNGMIRLTAQGHAVKTIINNP